MKKMVLFLSPKFFGYEKIIQNAIREQKLEVDYYPNNYIELQNKFFRKFFKKSLLKKNENYYKNILNKIKNKRYDYLFVIKGDYIPNDFFENIITLNKEIKIISYQWDDIDNCKYFLEKQKYYHKIFTYSIYDAMKYNFQFLPMFNIKYKTNKQKKYDIFLIGTLHKSREKIFFKFKSMPFVIVSHLLVDSPKMKLKLFFRNRLNDMKKTNLEYEKYIELLEETKCILDVPAGNQKGLTTRVIEGLSLNVKIITTNKEIQKYEFYTADNIKIIDFSENLLEKEIKFFLKQPFKNYGENYWKKYNINEWIVKIFDENK